MCNEWGYERNEDGFSGAQATLAIHAVLESVIRRVHKKLVEYAEERTYPFDNSGDSSSGCGYSL
jgi:hypothetical protein